MEKSQKSLVDIRNESLDAVQFLVDLRDNYLNVENGFNALIQVIDVMLKLHNEFSYQADYNDKVLDFRKKIETDIESYSKYREAIQIEITNELKEPKSIPMCLRIQLLLGEI